MAFALLNGGPECAGPNPLTQALKATSHDGSLQRDLQQQPMAGPSQSLRQSMNATPEARAEEERFYRSGGGGFDMSGLRQGLPPNEFQAAYRDVPAAAEHTWMHDFHEQQRGRSPMPMSQPAMAEAIPTSAAPGYAPQQYAAMSGMAMGMGMGQFGGGGMYRPSFASGFGASSYMNQQPVYEGKGKQKAEEGRFVELADDKAWDAAFEKIAAPPQVSLPDAVEEPDVDSDPMAAQLDAEWRRMQSDLNSYSAMDKEMAEWEAQYGSQFANPDGDFSFSNRDAFDYDELLRNPPVFEFQQEENAFLDSADPFEEGKRLLAAGAPFIEVEAAFEAACQKDQGRCDAWTALGETLAADEKELLAIKALERAISLPSATGGESAWLSLAISYINEGLDGKALGVLEEWLKRTYPQIASQAPAPRETTSEEGTYNPWANQQRIIDMFLAAARAGPAVRAGTSSAVNEQVDADVQIGLGVLFYGNSDYTLAKDCFEAALSVKPDDYILWNRLGATLANGGHPEDAISAYRTALSIRPNFTRSLYNLGVSCLNINCFQEAAEHLLAALELQGTAGKGEEADGLWQTLRRTFVCMERPDLAEQARRHADLTTFKGEFSF